jgi:hypothetical protein
MYSKFGNYPPIVSQAGSLGRESGERRGHENENSFQTDEFFSASSPHNVTELRTDPISSTKYLNGNRYRENVSVVDYSVTFPLNNSKLGPEYL